MSIDKLRGFKDAYISFDYPVTAICGPNGSGKSTVLACAACAFKAKPKRLVFSEFFVKSKIDGFFEGAHIVYSIRNPDKKTTVEEQLSFIPQESHIRKDTIKKTHRRWDRIPRTPLEREVHYIGLSRIIPAFEVKLHRKTLEQENVKFNLLQLTNQNLINEMKGSCKSINLHQIEKKELYSLETEKSHYTSLHMGAGEDVFCQLQVLFDSLSEYSLVLIDEVEIGLHPFWQKKLMHSILTTSYEKKVQFILSTHSPYILDELPSSGRLYITRENTGCIQIFNGVTTHYAMNQLGAELGAELIVVVEDSVAVEFVKYSIAPEQRKRVKIIAVGDKNIVAYQMAALFKLDNNTNCCAVLDGDVGIDEFQRCYKKSFSYARDIESNSSEINWVEERISFLPGPLAPERVLLKALRENHEFLNDIIRIHGVSVEDVSHKISLFDDMDHHDLFEYLAEVLGEDARSVRSNIIKSFCQHFPDKVQPMSSMIENRLTPIEHKKSA